MITLGVHIEQLPGKGVQIFSSLKMERSEPTAEEMKHAIELNLILDAVLKSYFAHITKGKSGASMATSLEHGHLIEERIRKLRGE
jgi:hypothetical protein